MTASESEETVPYASLVLEVIIAVYLFHTYLDLRQYRVKNTSELFGFVVRYDL